MNINKRSKPNIKIKAKYVPKLVKGADRRNKIITKNFFKTSERKQTFDKLMAEPMELLIAAFTQLTAVEGSPTHIIVHVSTRICSRIQLLRILIKIDNNKFNSLHDNKRLFNNFSELPKDLLKGLEAVNECIQEAYARFYNCSCSDVIVNGGVLRSLFECPRQGYHMDDELPTQFSMFFGLERYNHVHIATHWNEDKRKLEGKSIVKYAAGDLVICKPMLPHAGAFHSSTKFYHHRLFYSIGKLAVDVTSQRWFYEKGHKYLLHNKIGIHKEKLKCIRNIPFCDDNDYSSDV